MYLDVSRLKCAKEVSDPIQNMNIFRTDFTGKCNIDCNFCYGFHNMNEKNVIPFDKACEILDVALGDMKLKFAFLDCEGEFTQYENAVDILDYVEDTFSGVNLFIYTNTTVIPKDMIERLNTMKNNRVYLATSICSWDRESYESYTRMPLYDTVIKNIKTYITQLSNKNVIYYLSVIYWNEEQFNNTYNMLCKLIEDCGKKPTLYSKSTLLNVNTENTKETVVPIVRNKGIDTVIVNEDYNDTSKGPIYTNFVNQRVQTVVRCWDKKENEPWPYSYNCRLLNESLIIKSNGDVVPCIGTLGFPEEVLGNVFEQKVTFDWIKSIFNSDKMKAIMWRNVHDQPFSQCARCVSGQSL